MKNDRIDIDIELNYVWPRDEKTDDGRLVVKVKCKFSNHGCIVEQADDNIKSHEKECPYREIKCVGIYCKEVISHFRLLEHINEKHSLSPKTSLQGLRTGNYSVTEAEFHRNSSWRMGIIKYQGKDFLTVFLRNQGAGLWYTWVYMLGTEKEAAQYKFTLRLPEKEKHGLVFSSTVSSVDIPIDDVIKGGFVGCFTDFVARTIWDGKMA